MKKDSIVTEETAVRTDLLALNGIKSLRDWKRKEHERNTAKVNNDGVGIENGPQKQW